MWLKCSALFLGAESTAEFRGLWQFLTLFGHLQSRSDLTGWTCAVGLTIFGVSGNHIHLWDNCWLILCSHCLIWLYNYNSKTNKIIRFTLWHVQFVINIMTFSDTFAFFGYKEIPRAFYMVQELPRLQRVCPYWELSQRASHWRHCNGNWLCVLQEIGLQL